MNYDIPFAFDDPPEYNSTSSVMENARLNIGHGIYIPDTLNVTQAATQLSSNSPKAGNGYTSRTTEAGIGADNKSQQLVSPSGPNLLDIVRSRSDSHSLRKHNSRGTSTNKLTSHNKGEHNNSSKTTNNLASSSNDSTLADTEHISDFTKPVPHNYYPDWNMDTSSFLGADDISQPSLFLPNTMGQLFDLDNLIFDIDSSYNSSSDMGLSKQGHRDNWVQFDANDDHVETTRAGLFHIPNGVSHHSVNKDLVDSNNIETCSTSEDIQRKAHENKNEKNTNRSTTSDQHYIADMKQSHILNSYNLPNNEKHKGRELGKHSQSTRHRHISTRHSETESQGDLPDVLTNQEIIINTTSLRHQSGRNSAPMFSRSEDSGSHFWKQKAAHPDSYSDSEHRVTSLFSEVPVRQDTLWQSQQHRPIRPHSVATSVFLNGALYDNIHENIQEEPISNHATAQAKRKQIQLNYGSTKSSSMPEDSNLERVIHGSSKSRKHTSDTKMIFKTPSSASLLSDSGLIVSPPIVSARTSQSRLTKLKSIFSSKMKASRYMPLDDSMIFGAHNSTLSNDDTATKDKKSAAFKVKDESNDGGHSNDIKTDDKTVSLTSESPEAGDGKDAKPETRTAVYKRRWYLLFLFSVSALLWNAVWSTWGPIAQSAKLVYDWTDGDIAMFIWLGNIPFLITMFPSSYLMDVTGMRVAMIVACGFMFLGAGFRCIPSDISTASWLIRIGQFLNGMAGTIPNSGPALLSALWFPPNQRASATAISTVAGYMGASISFVVGPLMVPQPNDLVPVNNTDEDFSAGNFLDSDNNTGNTTSYDAQKTGIMNMLYAECAVAAVLFILVLIYFPSKPPLPPSISASIPREKYIKGLKMLVKNKQFWVCALAFSVPIGVYEAWQVILDVNLDARGISQETAGWLDFYATVGGCVSGLLVCRFADVFTRQMKLFLLVFYVFASVAILWFTLVVLDILPFDHVSIFAAIIIAGVFLDGGGPLFFELTIEVSYPVGEGVTSGFTQMLCAAAGIVFLSLVQIESLGKQWMNWCFFGCVAIAIPLLFFINTTYGRADIDDMELDVSEDEEAATAIEAADSTEKTYLCGNSHI